MNFNKEKDLIIGLAIIKNRRPELWKQVQNFRKQKINSLLIDGYNVYHQYDTRESLRDSLDLPPLEYLKKTSMFCELEPIHHYLSYKTHSKLSNELKTINSFSEGLNHNDIIRWILPLYKSFLCCLCYSQSSSNEYEQIERILECVQLMMISYCSKIENFTNFRFIIETLFYKLLSFEISQNLKTDELKGLKLTLYTFLKKQGKLNDSFGKNLYFKFHLSTIVKTINLLLTNCKKSLIKLQEEQINMIVTNVRKIVETLTSLLSLFNEIKPRKPNLKQASKYAYCTMYKNRNMVISRRHYRRFENVFLSLKMTVKEQIQFLKYLCCEMVSSLSRLNWKIINIYLTEEHRNKLLRTKYEILALALMAQDPDMIVKIRTEKYIVLD
ncbi:hypothetical protein TPHA_0C01330 [Tetrapisispora phaffii CBS 4417]|uniref:Uncharacterized protein n=1 Tax=Tetrapisispora phaffii (strain ATCC 24235 / CBS 4417 / NBRC 1672 / NRRL Y-8282 / UCD 70-5) TaxID=1071381 RepID=G8BRB3_TETPH|nr:hypothetical protein TPHA_0C01330 [Tetrapisispora phaffii CBS 4417]CCE62289.1 hypothetical protein TPHA_0C01330 [Tetrapisispora phaffii CBS 4417]